MTARPARATPAALRLAAAICAGAAAGGCPGGPAARLACATAGDCDVGFVCQEGACVLDPAICPPLQPTFASINAGLLQPSCFSPSDAAKGVVGCHSSDAASVAQSRLDLKTNPLSALVGADGKGAKAAAVTGRPDGLLLVKPGDPANSFLVEKLKIATETPELGAGMPPATPRAVCADAVAQVSAWIAQGAKGP